MGEVVGGYGMHQPQHMQQVVGSCETQLVSTNGSPCQEVELKAAIDSANTSLTTAKCEQHVSDRDPKGCVHVCFVAACLHIRTLSPAFCLYHAPQAFLTCP